MSPDDVRILLVEDSPSDAFLATEEFASPAMRARFDVCHSETLSAALTRLANEAFDAVVLDLTLPDSDGFDTFERIFETAPDVAIIVWSGQTDETLAMRAVKAGAQDYVVKGSAGLLPHVVRYSIERNRARIERDRLEQQMLQVQKMELVGKLSAGLAHDFNNILSVIMGYNDLVLSTLPADAATRNYVEEIQHAAERAAGLTRQLLVFSRQETLEPSDLDLNNVVRAMERMLRRLAGEDIEFQIDLDEAIAPVHVDSGYIGQVIMNLVVNARDAMPEGGTIRISTRPARRPPIEGVPEVEEWVELLVNDSGCGIDKDTQARIFEAFFTTKEKDQGTGLGLAISQNIIEQSGGVISVESEPGCGATFRVTLPGVGSAACVSDEPPPAPLHGGSETVLVAEDDPAVRRLASAVLEGMGYNVLVAADGDEGLEVAAAHRGPPIRLVLADVVMPKMSGSQMVADLIRRFPGLRVVFTSGYSSDIEGRGGAVEETSAFLPKPYTPTGLARAVREALNASHPPPPLIASS